MTTASNTLQETQAATERSYSSGFRVELDLVTHSGTDGVYDQAAYDKLLLELLEDAESIKGFKRLFDLSDDPGFLPEESTRSPWSIYTVGRGTSEPGGAFELYNTGPYDIPAQTVPVAIVECPRAVEPRFFMNNTTGDVFGVFKRDGLKFSVLLIGFASKCKKVGPFRTCVHQLA